LNDKFSYVIELLALATNNELIRGSIQIFLEASSHNVTHLSYENF